MTDQQPTDSDTRPAAMLLDPADPTFGGNGQFTLTTRQGLTYVLDAGTGQLARKRKGVKKEKRCQRKRKGVRD